MENPSRTATATDGGFEKATAERLVKSVSQIYDTIDRAIPIFIRRIFRIK